MTGADQMPAESKQIVHLAMDGQKSLRLANRFESAHPPLMLAGVLMRSLTSVVSVSVLAVTDRRHDFPSRRRVTRQFVGDHSSRRFALVLQHFVKESLRCTLVLPALHENIDDITVLVDGAPQIMTLASALE